MAIAKNGINRLFSGKTGLTVGYIWKGRPDTNGRKRKTQSILSVLVFHLVLPVKKCRRFTPPRVI